MKTMSMYTIREVATETGLTVRTIREMLRMGKLHGMKDSYNGRWSIPDNEVERVFGEHGIVERGE